MYQSEIEKKADVTFLSQTFATALAAIFLLSSVLSCKGDNNDKNPEKNYEIKVIDSCEYIYVSRRPWAGNFSLTHKGNCKFCAARHSRYH